MTAAIAMVCLAPALKAHAAGGAHVVDDATVETPGTCHLEGWVSRYTSGGGLAALAPGCTFAALPRLEVGGSVQRIWTSPADWTAGPGLKLNLRPTETGVGLAVAGAVAWSVRSGRLETASLILPASFRINPRLRLNLNVGWLYTRAGDDPNEAFIGAQVEADVARDLMLMGEVFTRVGDRPGGQLGLRWTPDGGALDVDLLAGWRTDGVTPFAVTVGMTLRR